MIRTHGYGMAVDLPLSFELARERVVDALKQEGFGVLTEIDVKSTMKQKLDEDFRRYVILGACNPPLAHRALTLEPEIGLLLPCNVVVYEREGGGSTVASVDPEVQLGKVGRNDLAELAREVRGRLTRVLEATAGSA